MAVPKARKVVACSARPRPDTHRLLGPLDEAQSIGVTVIVRAWPGSPPLRDLKDWHATPVAERHYSSAEEYARLHGASPTDLAAVERFAASHGLAVRASHIGRRSVTLVGTAAQMNAAFGVTLNRYEAPVPPPRKGWGDATPETHTHHGYDGPVHVPTDLSGVIVGVVGLDDRRMGAPAGGSGDPPGATWRSVAAVAGTYNFPNTGAADQTIGVVTMGGAYSHKDITQNYFPNLSDANYKTAPSSLNDISLTVGTTTYSNSASAVAVVTSANLNTSSSNEVLELTKGVRSLGYDRCAGLLRGHRGVVAAPMLTRALGSATRARAFSPVRVRRTKRALRTCVLTARLEWERPYESIVPNSVGELQ
jgi:hypothetical protein